MSSKFHNEGSVKVGDCQVNLDTRHVRRHGYEKALEPRVMAVLQLLIENPGVVLKSEDMVSKIWHPDYVGDPPLAQAIAKIRMALGDDAHNPSYIETVPKTGYRLIAEVSRPVEKIFPSLLANRTSYFLLGGILVGFIFVLGTSLDVFNSDESSPVPTDTIVERAQTLIVFPIENLTGSDDYDYVCEGISHELRFMLSSQTNLSVIDHYSTKEYQRSELPASEIPNVLGANYSLSGSLREDAGSLRVVTRLIDHSRGIDLWSGAYDYSSEGIISMHKSIAKSTRSALVDELGLSNPQIEAATPRYVPTDFTVYLDYLQARHMASIGTDESLQSAITLYESAISKDPQYSLAWVGLTRTLIAQLARGIEDRNTGFAKAWSTSEKSLQLDPQNSEAWANACVLQVVERMDRTAGEPYCQKAVELGPDSSYALRIAAQTAVADGDLDSALGFSVRRLEIDPLNDGAHAFHGLLLFFDEQFDRAKESVEHALRLNERRPMAYGVLGHIALSSDDPLSAIEYFGQESVIAFRDQGLIMTYAAMGDRQRSDELLAQYLDNYSSSMAFQIAEIYGFRGEQELAIQWLETSREHNDAGLNFIRVSPYLKALPESALRSYASK